MRKTTYREEYPEAIATPTEQIRTIRLKIDGLTQVYDAEGTFELSGVTVADVDYPAISEMLIQQGVSRDIAEPAVEKLAENLWASMLGRELAKRSRLV